MVKFSTTICKFDKQGEKTGWTYIEVPADIARKLMPGNKKSFRVKGKLENYPIAGVALLPMGEGNFVMALNASMRKGLGRRQGAVIRVQLEVDDRPFEFNQDFMDCLSDEPAAKEFFESLPGSHQRYFSKWIDDAKTLPTRAKRIAKAVNGLSKKMNFGEMLRAGREH